MQFIYKKTTHTPGSGRQTEFGTSRAESNRAKYRGTQPKRLAATAAWAAGAGRGGASGGHTPGRARGEGMGGGRGDGKPQQKKPGPHQNAIHTFNSQPSIPNKKGREASMNGATTAVATLAAVAVGIAIVRRRRALVLPLGPWQAVKDINLARTAPLNSGIVSKLQCTRLI